MYETQKGNQNHLFWSLPFHVRSWLYWWTCGKLGFLPLADAKKERACVATPLTERSHGFCRSSFAGTTKFIGMWGYKSSVPAWALKEFCRPCKLKPQNPWLLSVNSVATQALSFFASANGRKPNFPRVHQYNHELWKNFNVFPLLIFHSDNKIFWVYYFKNVVPTKISDFPTALRSSCYLHHTIAVMRPLQLCCS